MCVKTVINTLLKKLIATIFPKNDAVPLWFNCNMSLCNTVTSQFHHRRISSILQVIVTTQFHHRRISSILQVIVTCQFHHRRISSILYKSQWHFNSITVESRQFFTSHHDMSIPSQFFTSHSDMSIPSPSNLVNSLQVTVTCQFHHRRISSILYNSQWHVNSITVKSHQFFTSHSAVNSRSICSCDQHLRQRNYTVTLRFRIQEREMSHYDSEYRNVKCGGRIMRLQQITSWQALPMQATSRRFLTRQHLQWLWPCPIMLNSSVTRLARLHGIRLHSHTIDKY